MPQLNILTLNLWGTFGPDPAKRWDFAASECRALDLDAVLLQEASDADLLQSFARSTGLKILISDPAGSQLAILSRYPSARSGLRLYRAQSSLGELSRKLAWADLVIGDTTLRVITTHLSWRPDDTAVRREQAAEAALFAIQTDGPVVLSGDFNATIESGELDSILQAGYQDAAFYFPPSQQPTWDNAHPYIQTHKTRFPDRRIDLIFLKPGTPPAFRPVNCRRVLDHPNTDGLYPSDHYGIFCSISAQSDN